MKRYPVALALSVVLILSPFGIISGQNLSRLSKFEGMTSNYVLSLCQDPIGLIWLGTSEGLKVIYNGTVHPVDIGQGQELMQTTIEHIIETSSGSMWIKTPYALSRLDLYTGNIYSYPQFTGKYLLRGITGEDDVLVLDKNDRLFIYRPETDSFEDLNLPIQSGGGIMNLCFERNYLWTAGRGGLIRYPWIVFDGRKTGLGSGEVFQSTPVAHCNMSKGGLHIVDENGRLSLMDISRSEKTDIMDLSDEISRRGAPTAIVSDGESLFVSFKEKGILRYFREGDSWKKEDFGIKAGVLAMKRDRLQDILWIATNGDGLYKYWKGECDIRNYRCSYFGEDFTNPVKAILPDGDCLWIGTDGSGIMRLERSSRSYTLTGTLTSHNSPLRDNNVHCLVRDSLGILIGTGAGLDYYDRPSGRFLKVLGGDDIKEVRSISPMSGGRIVVCTYGYGVFMARLERDNATAILTDCRSYSLDGGDFSSNIFTSSTVDSSGNWALVANRNGDVYRLGTSGMRQEPFPGEEPLIMERRNFSSLCLQDTQLWCGSGSGVFVLDSRGAIHFLGKGDGMANSAVHALIPDGQRVWASTNDGVLCIGQAPAIEGYWGHREGLDITEFTDNAVAKQDGTFFFGGVEGWVEMTPTGKKDTTFVPPFFVSEFSVGDITRAVYQWAEKEGNVIRLSHRNNSFKVSLAVLDNVDGYSFRYRYRLDKDSRRGQWVDNGRSPELYFAHLPPGKYTLRASCYDIFSGRSGDEAELRVDISAPWYWTAWSKTALALLLISGALFALSFFRKRENEKRTLQMEEIRIRNEENLYKEKLQFFSNITHEFKTPLALIFLPCERILSYGGADAYVKKHVGIIKDNTERLHYLIGDILEFSRLERSEVKARIRPVDLSRLTGEVSASFSHLILQGGIGIEENIPQSLVWNSDSKFYTTILSNLLSNAVKYTPRGGVIRLTLEHSEQDPSCVVLNVYNTGKGISEENIKGLFDNKRILDTIEEKASKGIMSQNGLGLAICRNMTSLLGGTISVSSQEGQWALFTVTLPMMEETPQDNDGKDSRGPEVRMEAYPAEELPSPFPEDSRQTVSQPLGAEQKKERPRVLGYRGQSRHAPPPDGVDAPI